MEGDEPVALEGFIRDITITKLAERRTQASRKSRELLLSYVSHELRTPRLLPFWDMPVPSRMVRYMRKRMSGKPWTSSSTKSITLERLINDLFQLSKLETKQFSFRFRKMEALDLTIGLVNKYSMDIEKGNLKLKQKSIMVGFQNGFCSSIRKESSRFMPI